MEDDSHSFKLSYLPIFMLIGAASTICALAGIMVKFGIHLRPVTLGATLIAGLALSLMVAIVMADITRVVVTPRGLMAPDYSGRQRLVEWQQIVSVRPLTLLGLKFLRLFPGEPGSVPWLPLFLADRAGFRASVLQQAGGEHPLVVYLRLDRA